MSERQPADLREGCYEWPNVTEGANAHLERALYAVVQARGEYEVVKIMGSLFEDGPEIELCRLMPSYPLERIEFPPKLIRPVVEGGTATVRLYAPQPRG